MKRTLKRLLCVLLVAMIALSLAACGGGKSDQQQSSQQTTQDGNSGDAQSQGDSQPQTGLKKLTISHHPVLSGLPAYVAIQKGFFEEEGLDVDMDVYISGASQMEALPSGSWSCGGAGATAGCLGT
ncbi:ABC transporter substrate-binding protein, partial [uncultured Oscillibacter sp.]|uniref:ABC transporter substrate-binding protein n=1 Tax=uncultured Oscillibacter sp. TaxID=876091 RepID=UPI002625457D